MNLLHEPLRLSLTAPLLKAIEQVLAAANAEVQVTPTEIYNQLVEPPNTDLGHLAYGCFLLAKALKKSPPMAAAELKAIIGSIQGVASIEVAGPYLNFKFSAEALANLVVKPALTNELFKQKLTEKNPKSMIEFSQPNTHKEIHVGHMRNLCLGDALVKMLRYSGNEIISSTFPGDVGTHVAKCLWYIQNHVGLDVLAEKRNDPERGEWLGQMYSSANLKLEDEEKTEKYETNKKQLTEILKQLEAGQGQFYDLWKETRGWSIELMKKVYHWAGVEFDQWYWESDVDAASVKMAKKYFAEGKLFESQGAIGLDFSSDNLGFCMLLKSDGTGLYATKDIELARRKFEDFKIEKSIYVVDVRQALHFKQVFKALDILGFSQAKNCFHLQYNFVELPDGAMSSRKGNIIPLMHLVSQMKHHVKTEYLSRYEVEWSKEEIETVSDCVAQGAIKYGMLRQDTNKKIVFDMNEWLKLDGESGPFIQYSYARIQSIINKFAVADMHSFNGALLDHAAEIKLMQHLMNFNSVVLSASENYKPALICTYLYETAKKFNVFYHECSIGKADTEELKKARLALATATANILKQGLALLGIPVPNRM
ncbi:MAG: arginine--tRNA ligase [Pseudobdellovibrio sp.]